MPEVRLLIAKKNRKILDLPGYLACGMAGYRINVLNEEDLIPLPPTSEIFILPDRIPIGYNIVENRFNYIENFNPVSAFIPPGYTQLLTPAYRECQGARTLPLFSYTPIAWYKNKFYVPAIRIDKRRVHDIRFMDMNRLMVRIRSFKNSKNRLINHLKTCALTYKCPNAINFFLSRYECPLPVSPRCNSNCIGCISYQKDADFPPTQPRIQFIPTPDEIAEIALIHINMVKNPIVSFGQGCEGEPLLTLDTILEAIKSIRRKTKRGTININTNASIPSAIELLCRVGIDTIRVSLNSVRREYYERYYRPCGYTFNSVVKSIQVAKNYKKFVSINYLIMPGFTDQEEEFRELVRFIEKTRIDMIQWRNLNYDPQRYFKRLGIKSTNNLLGIKNIIKILIKEFPALKHGYFNISIPKGNSVRI